MGEGLTLEKLEVDIQQRNQQLADVDAHQFVEWAAETFGERLVMSTSFGVQAAVMLHLVTRVIPNIPVIWIDTGYLLPETYQFAEKLTHRLKLNVKGFQSPVSPARMEALFGRLWEKDDIAALDRYDEIRKVEPMRRALRELRADAWLAGLRTEQTDNRKTLPRIHRVNGYYKLLPILHWTSKEIHEYLRTHALSYHPLYEKGYATVGDWHSSRPLSESDRHERDTRFRGLKQECGIHLQTPEEEESLKSSGL